MSHNAISRSVKGEVNGEPSKWTKSQVLSLLLLHLDLGPGLVIVLLFLSSLAVVGIDVAVLAHPVGVKFIVRTVPGLFCPAVLVVAVVAHALGVVLPLRVTAVVHLLAKYLQIYIFFFRHFTSTWEASSCLGVFSTCSRFYSFFDSS